MKTYTFEQVYLWGDNWIGELNLPDNAIFYKCDGDNQKQQSWLIVINKNDFNDDEMLVKGCCQVDLYDFDIYTILSLNNIQPQGWNSVNIDIILDIFNGYYVNEYKLDIPNKVDDLASIIDDFCKNPDKYKKIIASYKIIGPDFESGALRCHKISVGSWVDYCPDINAIMADAKISLNEIDNISGTTKTKFVLSKDNTIYNNCLNKIINIVK